MKTTTLLICTAAICILSFTFVSLVNESLALVLIFFTTTMVILPLTVYKVLRNGSKLKQRYLPVERNERR